MEPLERARARQSRRLSDDTLKPVEIRSVGDIKRVVSEFDPAKNPDASVITLNTQLEVQEGNEKKLYAVTADTKSKSKRDHLIEGLQIVQNRVDSQESIGELAEPVEINGRVVNPPKLGSGTEGHAWVDPLIKQWLGGFRDGTVICWDLDDGYRYKYDIFEHKLTRVARSEHEGAATSPSSTEG